jgi:two-component system sensor histidine kinase YesM
MKSLKSRMIIYLSLIIGASLSLLGVISYVTFSSFTEKEMIKNTSFVTDQVNRSMDMYLNDIKESLHFMAIDQKLISILQESTSDNSSFDQNIIRSQISVLLNNMFSEKTDIRGYFIYNQDTQIQYINSGSSVDFNSKFLQQVWADFKHTKYALQTKFYGAHKPDYYGNYSKGTDRNVITIAANLKDAYDPSNPTLYGVAIFDYNINKLKPIFDTMETQLDIHSLVIDDGRQVIYQTDSSLILDQAIIDRLFQHSSGHWTTELNGTKRLVTYSTSSVTGWKTVSILSFSQLNNKLSLIRNTTILLLCIVIFISIIFATAFTIRTTKPILTLVKFMKEVGKGKLDLRLKRETQYEEIVVLNRGFNEMLDKINELIADSVQRQLLQKDAEYNALQAKMNPHFLYNTLQSISSLSILGRTQDIEMVTHSLREMLQYSLYKQNEMVRIQDELKSVQNYMRIQNIRYDGRLSYHIHTDNGVQANIINKFVLQPIVENAIYHGLESKEGDWLIHIGILDQSNHIRIEIKDNGVGMTEKQLLEVRGQLAYKEMRSGRIGLSSIVDRMSLKFGPQAKMNIESELGTGTKIILILPKSLFMGGASDGNSTAN